MAINKPKKKVEAKKAQAPKEAGRITDQDMKLMQAQGMRVLEKSKYIDPMPQNDGTAEEALKLKKDILKGAEEEAKRYLKKKK